MTQKGIGALMTDMSEREKKTLFAGSVPIGLNRNQVGAWRARARGCFTWWGCASSRSGRCWWCCVGCCCDVSVVS